MSQAATPVEVFCSYAHEDEVWLRKLETHLSLLKRQGLISLWYDRLITPGTNWAKSIDAHLETASVILLLVSANFLASDYCYSTEMKRALERHEAGEALVIPILVRPVDWRDAPFAHLQTLPTDAKPITTWREQDRVLTDVATGIRRAIEEMPLLAASVPRAALPKIWTIPYTRNPFFLGRETELELVRQHLQTSQAVAFSQPQAISGLGGIGKSQVALEYAYRYHQDYQAVLWARAESTEALFSSYVAIAMELRLPEREEKEQEIIIQAVKRWLQTRRGWLLILDNADELALLPDFLPPAPGGHLLLTTRATATERLARRLEIETFLPEQGALLLLRRSGLIAPDAELSQISAQERDLALHISQELGGLPLALDQAGAYLEAAGIDLEDYWQLYQQHRTDLLAERKTLIPDHPAPVATTWSLSFERVKEKNPAAADLLRLCAFLSPDAIPEEVLTAGASALGPVLAPVAADLFLLNQAIEALRAYSLVRRDPREKTLSIHRLVQAVLQDEMNEEMQHLWAERAVRAVNTVFPSVNYENWTLCVQYLPQAEHCATLIKKWKMSSLDASDLLARVGGFFTQEGHHKQAESHLQQSLLIREKILGQDHSDMVNTLHNLAMLYDLQGKYEQGEAFYQRALAIYEKALGQDHPDIATMFHNLAGHYDLQGKYDQAETYYQRALAIREKALGSENLFPATTLHGLALLYERQNKYDQAEVYFQRALIICEKVLGPENPETANTFHGLARVCEHQNKYDQAETYYQRALAIREKVLGPENPETANVLHALAILYSHQSKYEQGEILYQRALAIREKVLGPDHLYTAAIHYGLAVLYEHQNKHEHAKANYQRALMVYEKMLGADHSHTVNLRNRLTRQIKADELTRN